MPLPFYLQADINDGMNPDTVLSVYCKVCGEYICQYGELEGLESEDDQLCDECEDDLQGEDKNDG